QPWGAAPTPGSGRCPLPGKPRHPALLIRGGRIWRSRRASDDDGGMKDFSRDLVRELEERAEVRVETEADGRRSSVIIWVVVTQDGVYVRSYRGSKGVWYQRLRQDGTGALRVGRRRAPARAAPHPDPARNRRRDQAYLPTYGGRRPEGTEA